MNQGALDRPTFEAIEAFVLERMGTEEREAFEQRMVEDAVLRAEVAMERDNIRAVELGGIGRTMKRIAQDADEQHDVDRGGRSLLPYAAAIAVLLIGALWWFNRQPANERLFAEHFKADPGLPVTMGATDDPVFADAMVSYKEERYADARAAWSTLLQGDPLNDTLRFYIASAALAEGDPASAIPAFTAIAGDSASIFRDRARWYLFLAHVRQGDLEQAAAVDLSGDAERAAEAKDILAKLKE